ncbi:MAG: methyltransferase domain-containing protein [Actinobacteria bacterium]|nr:MAG: methyltransferase domain-containing protein [Actinomycetota bacterium]
MPRLALQRAPSEYDDAFMDKMAGAYLEQTRWTKLRLSALLPLVEPHPGDRILDLGCAAGALTHFFSQYGATVTGVDSEPKAVERARSLFPDLQFEQADVAGLPQADHSIDKAVAGDLVEHLDEPTLNAMLRELRRVLVPGGTLSIYTPNPRHLIERLKAHDFVLAQNPTHIGLRTSDQLVAALERNGFKIDRVGWTPSFFPVLRTVERLLGRFSQTFRYRLCIRASS